MNKKRAFIKTVEVLFSIIIILSYLIIMLPILHSNSIKSDLNILNVLYYNDDFRNCVLNDNISYANQCADSIVKPFIPKGYDYLLNITDDIYFQFPRSNETTISESVFIKSNETDYKTRIVFLRYFKR